MMRGKLSAIFDSAPAALLLTSALLFASALASATHAQTARRQTPDARTATPSTATQNPTPPTRETQTPRAEESGAEPDLSITARVTADSLRFEKVPNPNVEFTGKPRRETVWQSERHNLPQQVQPGVTYRDIGITLRITSVFADIDRIVAEALGEVPAGDDPQPASTPPTQPDAQPQATSELQESKPAPTPSPAKAATRANARARHERRGRGR
ncbi:MAG TPA: hypothetical protein VGP08_20465 [Pyrinomonadaceae bacterium]|jgi:hypothetical protein|nr:hypothetical protein [Pyrinomonadaceae bacterium]